MSLLPPNASVATTTSDGKLLAPSALRNSAAIVNLISGLAPRAGHVFEIASGTGQHIVALARALPHLEWHPTEIAADRIDSINAYAAEAGLDNLHQAQLLDATTKGWADDHPAYDLIYLGNLLHLISDDAAVSILSETAKALAPDGTFVIYGPFMRAGKLTSDGDAKFHNELHTANPDIGYKNDAWVKQVLTAAGMHAIIAQDMPANNLAFIAKREFS
jgi:SAM-dependent methyltransferase